MNVETSGAPTQDAVGNEGASSKPAPVDTNGNVDEFKKIAQAVASETVKQALEASNKTNVESITKADIEQALTKQRQEISRAVAGDTGEQPNQELLEALLTDPEGVLSTYRDMITQQVRGEMKEFVSSAIGTEVESRKAGREVFKDRPDIISIEANQELFSLFYAQTDAKESVKERLKTAMKHYDLHKERAGEGSVKDRVAKAASISSASASGTPKETNENKKSDRELLQEELAERHARRKAQKNLFR